MPSKLEKAAIRFVKAYWAKPEAKKERRDNLHKCRRDVWLERDSDSAKPSYATSRQQSGGSDYSFCFDRTCIETEKDQSKWCPACMASPWFHKAFHAASKELRSARYALIKAVREYDWEDEQGVGWTSPSQQHTAPTDEDWEDDDWEEQWERDWESYGVEEGLTSFVQHAGRFTEKEFAQAFGIKRSSGRSCVARLTGQRCGLGHQGGCSCMGLNFGIDHRYAYYRPGGKKGKLSVFVWFPYGVDPVHTTAATEWAEQNGLRFLVFDSGPRVGAKSDPSFGWYGYGSSMVVLLDPADFTHVLSWGRTKR